MGIVPFKFILLLERKGKIHCQKASNCDEKSVFYHNPSTFKADTILFPLGPHKLWKVYEIIAPKQSKLENI
jgi:hypothetical protein